MQELIHSNIATDINIEILQSPRSSKDKCPAVILCHGFPETAYAWRHQLNALADSGYRAIAMDMRGYGRTQSPADVESYSLMHITGDIIKLMDALDIDKAVLVGNDWGSTVAWHSARLRPDRFSGIAAMGVPMMSRAPLPPTELFNMIEMPQDMQFYALYFQEPGLAEAELEKNIRTSLMKIYYSASGSARNPQENTGSVPNPFGMVSLSAGLLGPLPERMPEWLSDSDFEVFVNAFTHSGFRGGLNYYRNLDRNWQHEAALEGLKIEIPALYMVGERDTGYEIPGMKEIIEYMPNLAPKLTDTLVFEGVGHWLQQERPGEVSKALCDFIRKTHPA